MSHLTQFARCNRMIPQYKQPQHCFGASGLPHYIWSIIYIYICMDGYIYIYIYRDVCVFYIFSSCVWTLEVIMATTYPCNPSCRCPQGNHLWPGHNTSRVSFSSHVYSMAELNVVSMSPHSKQCQKARYHNRSGSSK